MLSSVLDMLGSVVENRGCRPKPKPLHCSALEIDERTYCPDGRRTLTAVRWLAGFLAQTGRPREAEVRYRRNLDPHHPLPAPEERHRRARRRLGTAGLLTVGLLAGGSAPPAAAKNQVGVAGVNAATREACSPVVVGAGGNVTINASCSTGLPPGDLERIVAGVRRGLMADAVAQVDLISQRFVSTQS